MQNANAISLWRMLNFIQLMPKAASPAGALPGWAYEAGLMRLAGIAVQFRQREFQDWLTLWVPETVHTARDLPIRPRQVPGMLR